VILGLTALLGWTSLLGWAWFLFAGSLDLVDLGLGEAARLGWDAMLCLAFFVQHSGMVRRSYRQWSGRFIPPHYQGASYAIASGVVLLVLLVFWQASGWTLAGPQGPIRWLLRAVYVLSMAGFAWGTWALGSFDPFGLEPIRGHLGSTVSPSVPFTVRGPHRWVRHPVYAFTLLMIWSCPDLTADRLLLNVLFTVWIVVGAVLEERDLVAAFGQPYREYKRNVPMLIPYRMRPVK